MKKILLTAVALIGLVGNQAKAQNLTKKWYVSTGAHAVNHKSVRGLFDQYFKTDNWSFVPPPSQLTISRTLNGSLAIDVQASIGEVDNFRLDHNDEFMSLVGAGLRYRFANGYMLNQESWFDPYIRAGANYYRHQYRGLHFDGGQDVDGEIKGNGKTAQNNFFAVSGGVGINFWITQKFGINIESQYVWIPEMKSDYIDFFQAKAGVAFRFGQKVCKDRDKDGVCDDEDACPDIPGIKTDDPRTNGCPDKDKDGIFDFEDACPDVPGIRTDDPKTNGCPDKDGDGVFDFEDACPDDPGIRTDDPKTNGCPDTDGDGVFDFEDACPTVPGVRTTDPKTNGCPISIPEPEQPVAPIVIPEFSNVLFEFNSSTLTTEGIDASKAAAAIIKEKGGRYFVDGFADSDGSDAYNIKLSRRRAEAVRKALIDQGIKPDQLEVRAFGEQYPKCTNETAEGRACNRRVVIIERY